MRDTIAAISTPLGAGGLGVIRISGPQARAVAARVFLPLGKKSVEKMTGYTCLYGHVKRMMRFWTRRSAPALHPLKVILEKM